MFLGENFCSCAQNTIHWKTFTVHQAKAIMYCTQQMIQVKNFHDWLKAAKVFSLRTFAMYDTYLQTVKDQ